MFNCKMDACPEKRAMCCFFCEKTKTCTCVCSDAFTNNEPADCENAVMPEDVNEIEVFKNEVAKAITTASQIAYEKKRLDDAEKILKEKIQASMEKHGIKKFMSDDGVTFTYVAPTTRTTIDSKKLKANYPEIAEECSKTSNVKASVRIKVD